MWAHHVAGSVYVVWIGPAQWTAAIWCPDRQTYTPLAWMKPQQTAREARRAYWAGCASSTVGGVP